MSGAREEILRRIREALTVPASTGPVARDYRRQGSSSPEGKVERFLERVAEYKAGVHRAKAAEVPVLVDKICGERRIDRLVIPPGLAWLPAKTPYELDRPHSHAELDATPGVLTGCRCAIAETGTLILDGGPGQGRRALTLLPDFHLCVVEAGQIVELVPEAMARLEARRPLTFVSGPSATSDIELSRVEGVHGPRNLEVVVVF